MTAGPAEARGDRYTPIRGAHIWVRLHLRFQNCGRTESPSSITHNQLEVQYHLLGRERTAMIEDCARWAAEGR